MAIVALGVLVLAGGTPDNQRSDESRAQTLGAQLKCLQCAGESVAASQAPLAQQFRNEIDRQLDQGATDPQILDWFVDRYGEEVLLDPPTSGLSAFIWVLPALAVLAAVVGLWFAFGRWRSAAPVPQAATGPADAATGPADAATGPADAATGPADAATGPADAVAGPRWRVPAVITAVLVFAGLAAWLVVWGSSDRGDGELTGGTGTAAGGGEIARCQSLARTEPEAGIECFDGMLEDDPDNVEALTYRGWAHIRGEDVEAGRVDLVRAVELDPTAADPHVFLAVAAADEGDFATAASELQQFWANDPSDVAISVVQSEGLERKVFFGLMSAPTRDCWQAAASGGEDRPIDQAFLDELGSCLDDVLGETPDDRDARLSRALAHVGPQAADPEAARALLDGVLAENRDDADALALVVSLDLAAGDLDAAEANLEHLEQLPRGTGAFLIGDAAVLRAALDAARDGG
jgi:cytochrome c-type biogenesis protein CcmH